MTPNTDALRRRVEESRSRSPSRRSVSSPGAVAAGAICVNEICALVCERALCGTRRHANATPPDKCDAFIAPMLHCVQHSLVGLYLLEWCNSSWHKLQVAGRQQALGRPADKMSQHRLMTRYNPFCGATRHSPWLKLHGVSFMPRQGTMRFSE